MLVGLWIFVIFSEFNLIGKVFLDENFVKLFDVGKVIKMFK